MLLWGTRRTLQLAINEKMPYIANRTQAAIDSILSPYRLLSGYSNLRFEVALIMVPVMLGKSRPTPL